MNISFRLSKNINRFERHYKLGDTTKSKYLMIKRESSSPLGLFAYYISNLSWIEYALRFNMTPVIDMQNFPTAFHQNGEVKKVNTWEYFFKQPSGISVEEALRSGKARYVWRDVPEFHPNESLDFLLDEELVDYYRKIADQYIRFQDNVSEQLENERKTILGNKGEHRIVGVLARGTDYVTLKPYAHPIQPNVDQLIEKVNDYRKKYDCRKIYVATEDAKILDRLKNVYGEDLLYTNQKRIYDTKEYLNFNAEFTERSPFERGMEHLKSIYLLAKCNGMIAGRTSGTVGALLMADHYEFQYVFSLGRYGIEEPILTNQIV